MDDDEQLDWGDEHIVAADDVIQDDDAQSAVSLGAEPEDDEFYSTYKKQHENENEAPQAGADETDSEPEPSATAGSGSGQPKLMHALPPKPVGTVTPYIKPNSYRDSTGGTSAQSMRGSGSATATTNSAGLPYPWEARTPSSGKGQYFFNPHTNVSTWTRPVENNDHDRDRDTDSAVAAAGSPQKNLSTDDRVYIPGGDGPPPSQGRNERDSSRADRDREPRASAGSSRSQRPSLTARTSTNSRPPAARDRADLDDDRDRDRDTSPSQVLDTWVAPDYRDDPPSLTSSRHDRRDRERYTSAASASDERRPRHMHDDPRRDTHPPHRRAPSPPSSKGGGVDRLTVSQRAAEITREREANRLSLPAPAPVPDFVPSRDRNNFPGRGRGRGGRNEPIPAYEPKDLPASSNDTAIDYDTIRNQIRPVNPTPQPISIPIHGLPAKPASFATQEQDPDDQIPPEFLDASASTKIATLDQRDDDQIPPEFLEARDQTPIPAPVQQQQQLPATQADAQAPARNDDEQMAQSILEKAKAKLEANRMKLLASMPLGADVAQRQGQQGNMPGPSNVDVGLVAERGDEQVPMPMSKERQEDELYVSAADEPRPSRSPVPNHEVPRERVPMNYDRPFAPSTSAAPGGTSRQDVSYPSKARRGERDDVATSPVSGVPYSNRDRPPRREVDSAASGSGYPNRDRPPRREQDSTAADSAYPNRDRPPRREQDARPFEPYPRKSTPPLQGSTPAFNANRQSRTPLPPQDSQFSEVRQRSWTNRRDRETSSGAAQVEGPSPTMQPPPSTRNFDGRQERGSGGYRHEQSAEAPVRLPRVQTHSFDHPPATAARPKDLHVPMPPHMHQHQQQDSGWAGAGVGRGRRGPPPPSHSPHENTPPVRNGGERRQMDEYSPSDALFPASGPPSPNIPLSPHVPTLHMQQQQPPSHPPLRHQRSEGGPPGGRFGAGGTRGGAWERGRGGRPPRMTGPNVDPIANPRRFGGNGPGSGPEPGPNMQAQEQSMVPPAPGQGFGQEMWLHHPPPDVPMRPPVGMGRDSGFNARRGGGPNQNMRGHGPGPIRHSKGYDSYRPDEVAGEDLHEGGPNRWNAGQETASPHLSRQSSMGERPPRRVDERDDFTQSGSRSFGDRQNQGGSFGQRQSHGGPHDQRQRHGGSFESPSMRPPPPPNRGQSFGERPNDWGQRRESFGERDDMVQERIENLERQYNRQDYRPPEPEARWSNAGSPQKMMERQNDRWEHGFPRDSRPDLPSPGLHNRMGIDSASLPSPAPPFTPRPNRQNGDGAHRNRLERQNSERGRPELAGRLSDASSVPGLHQPPPLAIPPAGSEVPSPGQPSSAGASLLSRISAQESGSFPDQGMGVGYKRDLDLMNGDSAFGADGGIKKRRKNHQAKRGRGGGGRRSFES